MEEVSSKNKEIEHLVRKLSVIFEMIKSSTHLLLLRTYFFSGLAMLWNAHVAVMATLGRLTNYTIS